MTSLAITEQEFEKFRSFFYRKTGILFENSKRYFVDKRLIERIEATDSETFRTYFTMVRFQASGEEMQVLTNLMTVNETYFLREEYQFRCLVESLLPDVIRRRKRGDTIRIWCVPSSSGEEAYGLAIYLLEHWPALADWSVEIISSDINTDIPTGRGRASTVSAPCTTCPILCAASTLLERRLVSTRSATSCEGRWNSPG